jgi:hypothetical protein
VVLAAEALPASPREVALKESRLPQAPLQPAWFQLEPVEAPAGAVSPRAAQVRQPVVSV